MTFKMMTALIVLAITSCSSSIHKERRFITSSPVANSGPELRGIRFKPQRPTETDSLFEATEDPETAKAILSDNVQTINRFYTDYVFRVVGSTDNEECPSEQQCLVLSLRRARLLHEWLVNNGVSSRNLMEPTGFGKSRPIQDNTSPEGRRINRNAFIDLEKY